LLLLFLFPPKLHHHHQPPTTPNNPQQHNSNLFDRYVDANALVVQLERLATSSAAAGRRVTPKMFQHSISAACQRDPQRIVLPEGTDGRVLAAAAETTARGLARVTLLGDPAAVRAEAGKLGLDISRCEIVDPATSDRAQAYAELYTSIRSAGRSSSSSKSGGGGVGGVGGKDSGAAAAAAPKKPAAAARPPPTLEASLEAVRSDVNLFGVMMVRSGAADGMVSGAAHTTAATVRPAMQVLRKKEEDDEEDDEGSAAAGAPPAPSTTIPAATRNLVSSVFFMCLPDRVVVYGDCALVVSPTAEELASIAVASADTAAAFGLEPRVAMLSYSTLGSGKGPEVERVARAVEIVKQWRPDLMVEGPIQYDAAADPAVAKLKIKGASSVAGKATVFVFPDLNAGNVAYKAVQQSSGAIAMGPVLQNLLLPVNDLSRGCTVKDVVSTIAVTSVQAQQAKEEAARRKGRAERGAVAEAA
jgi:phosphate acetyltransferase